MTKTGIIKRDVNPEIIKRVTIAGPIGPFFEPSLSMPSAVIADNATVRLGSGSIFGSMPAWKPMPKPEGIADEGTRDISWPHQEGIWPKT